MLPIIIKIKQCVINNNLKIRFTSCKLKLKEFERKHQPIIIRALGNILKIFILRIWKVEIYLTIDLKQNMYTPWFLDSWLEIEFLENNLENYMPYKLDTGLYDDDDDGVLFISFVIKKKFC